MAEATRTTTASAYARAVAVLIGLGYMIVGMFVVGASVLPDDDPGILLTGLVLVVAGFSIFVGGFESSTWSTTAAVMTVVLALAVVAALAGVPGVVIVGLALVVLAATLARRIVGRSSAPGEARHRAIVRGVWLGATVVASTGTLWL